MGILDNLFGGTYIQQIPQPPMMLSVLPPAAMSAIQRGQLPKLNVSTLILSPGEVSHFVDKSCLVTEKTLRHYQRRNSGMSFRIMKGVTYHTGGGQSHPMEQQVPVYTPGYLYITNKRVVFVAREKSFEKKLTSLTAVTPYSDAVGLQFGSKTFNLLLPAAYLAQRTLELVSK